jgi:hypothetical protein
VLFGEILKVNNECATENDEILAHSVYKKTLTNTILTRSQNRKQIPQRIPRHPVVQRIPPMKIHPWRCEALVLVKMERFLIGL